MGIGLLFLAAAAVAPPATHGQALATARIVDGSRIHFTSTERIPEARRRITHRQETGRAAPTELRLVEFQ